MSAISSSLRLKLWRFVAGAMTATLVACGGGSGGGGASTPSVPTAPVTITGANAQTVAGEGYLAGTGVTDSGGLVAVGAQTANMPPPKPVLARIAAKLPGLIEQQRSSPQTVTGASHEQPCDSGTFAVEDNGSSATITFNFCSFYPGEWINGYVSVSSIVGGGTNNWSATVGMNLTYHADGFPDTTFTGSFDVAVVENSSTLAFTVTISNASLTMSDGSETVALSNLSFTVDDDGSGNLTFFGSFTVASTSLGGSVTVQMTGFEMFASEAYPHAGVMTITGASGSVCKLTVLDNMQVRVEWDANGDGTFEGSRIMTWAELTA